MGIARRTLVVNVTVSQWSGRKLDKAASDEVAASKGSKAGRARLNKLLIRKEALTPVQAAARAIRDYVAENSVPWGDGGERAILAANYLDFTQRLGELIREFKDEANQLADDYTKEVERARFELNALFNPDDYPSEDYVRKAFDVKVGVRPMVTGENLIVDDLDESMLADIRQQVEQDLAETESDAMKGVWQSIIGMVEEMRDRMAAEKPRFRRALIDNFVDLTERLSRLNVAGDPELDRLREELRRSLTGYSADELRKDADTRKEFVTEADRILAGFVTVSQNEHGQDDVGGLPTPAGVSPAGT